METEQALAMSLDDIINKQKKERPLGSKKTKGNAGQRSKQAPKVYKAAQGNQRPGQANRNRQAGNNAGRTSGQQRSGGFNTTRRPVANGAISKPARKGPQAQTNKGKQRGGQNIVPGIQAPKQTSSMNEPLKITISNDRSQRPVLPRPQPRPVIPNPSQQFAAPSQAQASRMKSTVQSANGYATTARQTDYGLALQPVKQTYQDNVGRSLNNAASYLRDPYRGDDFERGSLGGMRSDAAYGGKTQRVRAYDNMLDDSLREDDYDRGRSSSYNNTGRQSGRSSRDAYRQ